MLDHQAQDHLLISATIITQAMRVIQGGGPFFPVGLRFMVRLRVSFPVTRTTLLRIRLRLSGLGFAFWVHSTPGPGYKTFFKKVVCLE